VSFSLGGGVTHQGGDVSMKKVVKYSLLMILIVVGLVLCDVIVYSGNELTIAWGGLEEFFKVFVYPVLIILILG